jgi:hypothetical protein
MNLIGDPFPEIPLLAGRLSVREQLSEMSESQLDMLWMEVYRYRYLAALIVGDNPLASGRREAIARYHDRVASARGQHPLESNADVQWINSEVLQRGPELEVEEAIDSDASIPDDFLLEHLPVYSAGNLLLYVLAARVRIRRHPGFSARLITVGEWRRANINGVTRDIIYRYYASNALARDSSRKYLLPATLASLVLAFENAQAS